MRHQEHQGTTDHHELLLAAPAWIIRGSAVVVVLTLLLQVAAAIDAPEAPTAAADRAVLALMVAAPGAGLAALTALVRFRLGPDVRTAAEVLCIAAVACAGMLLAREADAPPTLTTTAPDGWLAKLPLTTVLLLGAAGAAALRWRSEVEARRTGSATRSTTIVAVALVVGLGSTCAAHVASWRALDGLVSAAVVVLAATVAAVALVGAAGVEVVHAVRERDRRALALRVHLAELEQAAHDQRRQRHEVSNSVAAIAMASSLIHHSPDLPRDTRYRLEEMLEREAEHLTALVAPRSAGRRDGVATLRR